jgi:hypothetical protein
MSFYTDFIQKSPLFNNPAECRDQSMLEPGFGAAVKAIIAEAAAMGITLMVTETFRSQARQQQLFRQGATQLNGLTPATIGVHHFGLAADFCKIIDGKASWAGDWSFLRDLADKHGLVSGVDWGQPNVKHSFIDPDHVQGCTVAQQSLLFAGTWYPGPPVTNVS